MIKVTDNTEFDFFYSENKEDFSGRKHVLTPNGKKYNIRLCKESRGGKLYNEILNKYGDAKLIYSGKLKYDKQ